MRWVPAQQQVIRRSYERLGPLDARGHVWLARQTLPTGVHRLVVLKQVASQRRGMLSLEQEVALHSAAQHPHLVPLLDVEDGPSGAVLVFPYVHGLSLKHLFNALESNVPVGRPRPTVPLEAALAVVYDVLGALEGLHRPSFNGDAEGVVHADLKPDNVLIDVRGWAQVCDLGCARPIDAHAERSLTVEGTPGYMSPEQVCGLPMSAASDVFGVAILLWEMLAGRRLVGGATPEQRMRAVVDSDAPDVRRYNPAVPGDVAALLEIALRRDHRARFQTAVKFRVALEATCARMAIVARRDLLADFVRRTGEARLNSLARLFTPATVTAPRKSGWQLKGLDSDEDGYDV